MINKRDPRIDPNQGDIILTSEGFKIKVEKVCMKLVGDIYGKDTVYCRIEEIDNSSYCSLDEYREIAFESKVIYYSNGET